MTEPLENQIMEESPKPSTIWLPPEARSRVASPTMEMRVEELEAWLRHYRLGLSVSFNDRCYSAELRIKVGGESIVAMEAKAAEFGVAVISACQNYERERANDGNSLLRG